MSDKNDSGNGNDDGNGDATMTTTTETAATTSTEETVIKPGSGWSNGDLDQQMFPSTRNGRLQLYASNRRWIGLNKGWSRVGGDDGNGNGNDGNGSGSGTTDQYSHRTKRSSQMGSLLNGATEWTAEQLDREARSVRCLIAQLSEQFYRFGWAAGTAGGVSIRVGGPDEHRPYRVFCMPSGIQKEDMIGDDVFELDMDQNVVHPPKTEGLKLSACNPIWYCVYKHRPSARAVIHTHGMNAQLATLLDPTETAKTLKLTHMEMLKGVGGHAYDDVLEIPILDNKPSEDLLQPQMEEALAKYPSVNCVLVRRHGLFVWGDSWEQAKTQAESFDYLFETAIGMRKLGVDFSAIPSHGAARTDFEAYHGKPNNNASNSASNNDSAVASASASAKREGGEAPTGEPPSKRSKPDQTATAAAAPTGTGWNAASDVDNLDDLKANPTPLLPRDYKYLLLDIEGCTTAISFVKDVLFPYVVEHAEDFCAKNLSDEERTALTKALSADLTPEQRKESEAENLLATAGANPAPIIRYMVKKDLKLASLKSFQGKMWKDGYANGTLKGHVYEDFVPMLEWMKSRGVGVYIYSSGSVQAQKLLFGKSIAGDLCGYFSGHFDITTSGNKKVAASYTNICQHLRIDPSELVFCSDAVAELVAASEAGVGQCVMTVRPGNAPLTKEQAAAHPRVFSLLQLCGSGL